MEAEVCGAEKFEQAMKSLLMQKDYPCVAALKSFFKKDFRLKKYSGFGEEHQRPRLRRDLLDYKADYLKSKSPYFTFWAIYENAAELSEEQFEQKLWRELSSLTSEELRAGDKDPNFSDDPEDKNFCFSLDGMAFFVVGLHPQSSRKSRQFPWPTLIFNVYEQFRQLEAQSLYQPMVKINRGRDLNFQGSANPMAVRHNDDWEAIQFSGKNNPDSWKCPFHFR